MKIISLKIHYLIFLKKVPLSKTASTFLQKRIFCQLTTSMHRHIIIEEQGLKDELQTLAQTLPTETKLQMISQLFQHWY